MITLRNILRINAVTSGTTGLALVSLPVFFASIFEVQQVFPFVAVGAFLIVFAVAVWLVSASQPVNRKGVNGVIVADCAWVLVSLLVLALDPFGVSLIGNILIAAVGLWVLLMAYLQFKAVRIVEA